MSTRFINPPTISKPPGYTHVVEATTPGRIVYVAGQLGLDTAGNVGGERPATSEPRPSRRLRTSKQALAAVGATFADVVKLNNYLTDPRSFADLSRGARHVTSTHTTPARKHDYPDLQAGARGRAAGDRSGCDPAGQGGVRDPHASRRTPGAIPGPLISRQGGAPQAQVSAFAHPACGAERRLLRERALLR